MVGQTIGKYRVTSRLGRGGMGTVYRAVDATLEREVAIKCINAELGDPDVLKRFRTEAVTLARLNHPNIATLFELTEHEGQLLMVMEFVRGDTFDRLLQHEGPLPVDRAAHLCIQALDALEHAHAAGVIHRDLKPANLMLTQGGLVKVMDFGLARVIGTEHLTNDGYMVGTPAYMSPEQVLGRDIDGRADLYAIGVVLYRLLTSQLPFKAESGIAMVQHQLNDPPTPVRQARADLPDVCETIITRALAKAADARYQSASEFKAALAPIAPHGATGVLLRPSASSPAIDQPTLPPTPSPGALRLPDESSPATLPLPRPAFSQEISSSRVATTPFEPLPAPPPRVPEQTARPAWSWFGIAAAALVFAGVPATGLLIWKNHSVPSAPVAAPMATAPAALAQSAPASSPPPASSFAVPALAASSPPPSAAKPAVPRATKAVAPKTAGAAGTTPVRAVASKSALPVMLFRNVRLLVQEQGKARDRDAQLRLAATTLDVVDGTTTLQSVAYDEVIGLFVSHSREPKWAAADGRALPLMKVDGGKLGFLKGAPDWLTVRTRRIFIPLRVRDEDLSRISTELAARTGTTVVRPK